MFEDGDYDHEKDGYIPEGPRSPDRVADAEALAKVNFRPWTSKVAQQSSSNSSVAVARDDNIDRLAGLGDDADIFGRQSAVTRSPVPAPQKRVQIRHPEGAEAEGDVFNVLHAPYQKNRE